MGDGKWENEQWNSLILNHHKRDFFFSSFNFGLLTFWLVLFFLERLFMH